MKIHEYQGKELLRKFGVPVPRGLVARSPEEAYQAAKELGTDVVVVKAQIHAGGRGKGGGVKLAKSADEAREIAQKMLGMKLVTHQTGPEGREVRARSTRVLTFPRTVRSRIVKERGVILAQEVPGPANARRTSSCWSTAAGWPATGSPP